MSLQGRLLDVPLIDLLRIFQRGERSGRIFLTSPAERAAIWFQQGQVVHAALAADNGQGQGLVGEAALFALLDWPDGQFRYLAPVDGERYRVTITRSTNLLILEALRRGEGQRSLPPGLSPHATLRAVPGAIGDEAGTLSPSELQVVSMIGQRCTAEQIADRLQVECAWVLQVVARLIDLGVVAVAQLLELPQRRVTVAFPSRAEAGEQGTSNLARAIRRRLSQLRAVAS